MFWLCEGGAEGVTYGGVLKLIIVQLKLLGKLDNEFTIPLRVKFRPLYS